MSNTRKEYPAQPASIAKNNPEAIQMSNPENPL